MSLEIAKDYVRYDSSHILICDRYGELHNNIPHRVKDGISKPRKINNISKKELSLQLGKNMEYVSRLDNEESPSSRYIQSLDEDIGIALSLYEDMKKKRRMQVLAMYEELEQNNRLIEYIDILKKDREIGSTQLFENYIKNLKNSKNKSIRKFSSFVKAGKFLDTYKVFLRK